MGYKLKYKRDNFIFEDIFYSEVEARSYQKSLEGENAGYSNFEVIKL